MPSFDITSEADLVALKNAVDVAGRHIGNRYDFKGTSARAELNEKDKTITLHGDSEFQLSQVKDILFPEMEKKERESTKRLDHGPVQGQVDRFQQGDFLLLSHGGYLRSAGGRRGPATGSRRWRRRSTPPGRPPPS